MTLNLLQIILSLVGIIFLIFTIDFFQRKKFNGLHLLVFVGGTALILYFVFYPAALNTFGSFFGLARGADLIVYSSIIILAYLYFELLNAHHRFKIRFTDLSRELSLQGRQGDIGDSPIVFVIPTFNESDDVIHVIKSILDKGYGIVFVDDGSQNNLFRKLKTMFLKDGNKILFMRHPINMGQGASLETGFEFIRRHGNTVQFVVTFDSDGQHRLEDLDVFIKAFEGNEETEIVLGSRFLGTTEKMPKLKGFILKLGIIFTWMLSGIKLTDTHNGYRMMRKETLEKIKITMNGMEHASEIIDIIEDKKIKFSEVPIKIIYTDYSNNKGTGKPSKALKVAANMIYKKFFFK